MQDLFWTQQSTEQVQYFTTWSASPVASPCKLLLPISAGDCFGQWNGTCSINSESNINKGKRKLSPWSRKSL